MTSMATLRPIIQRIVNRHEEGNILSEQWAMSYAHCPGTDITAEGILLTIAECRIDRDTRVPPNSAPDVPEGK